jgi:hypothetical protein
MAAALVSSGWLSCNVLSSLAILISTKDSILASHNLIHLLLCCQCKFAMPSSHERCVSSLSIQQSALAAGSEARVITDAYHDRALTSCTAPYRMLLLLQGSRSATGTPTWTRLALTASPFKGMQACAAAAAAAAVMYQLDVLYPVAMYSTILA